MYNVDLGFSFWVFKVQKFLSFKFDSNMLWDNFGFSIFFLEFIFIKVVLGQLLLDFVDGEIIFERWDRFIFGFREK